MIADISVYQGNIDWEKARKQLDFVIFRASVGNNADKKYITNAKECGIPFGVYHFFKAGTAEEAKKETEFFYQCATKEGLQPLFFCPDIEYETQTSKTTLKVCKSIIDTLRLLGAKKVGIYISQSRYPYIKSIKDEYDFIWIPKYGKNTGVADEAYIPKYDCDLWQYTSKGHIDGIPNRVDLNQIRGNKDLGWFLGEYKIEPPLKRSLFYLLRETVRKGNEGEAVRELQLTLNSFGYLCGRQDGVFDEQTDKAVRAFQKDYNLTVDGICGPKTVQKLIG